MGYVMQENTSVISARQIWSDYDETMAIHGGAAIELPVRVAGLPSIEFALSGSARPPLHQRGQCDCPGCM